MCRKLVNRLVLRSNIYLLWELNGGAMLPLPWSCDWSTSWGDWLPHILPPPTPSLPWQHRDKVTSEQIRVPESWKETHCIITDVSGDGTSPKYIPVQTNLNNLVCYNLKRTWTTRKAFVFLKTGVQWDSYMNWGLHTIMKSTHLRIAMNSLRNITVGLLQPKLGWHIHANLYSCKYHHQLDHRAKVNGWDLTILATMGQVG